MFVYVAFALEGTLTRHVTMFCILFFFGCASSEQPATSSEQAPSIDEPAQKVPTRKHQVATRTECENICSAKNKAQPSKEECLKLCLDMAACTTKSQGKSGYPNVLQGAKRTAKALPKVLDRNTGEQHGKRHPPIARELTPEPRLL